MKFKLLIFAFASLLIQCKSKKNSENVKVSLMITITNDYCGGALPTEEMLKEITSSKPYVSNKFYLVQKNEEGIVLTETEHHTDAEGKLTLTLKKGMYEVYLYNTEQKKNLIEQLDKNYRSCSTIFYEQPQAHLHAWQKGIQKVELHVKCNPCLPPAP